MKLLCYARRDGDGGDNFGAKYMEEFIPIVEELFERGETESSDKVQPPQVVEVIQQRYPNKLILPGDYEVRGLMAQLISKQSQKKNSQNTASNHVRSVQKYKLPDNAVKWVIAYLYGKNDITPTTVFTEMEKLKSSASLADVNFMEKPDIRKHISTIKAKIKADANTVL